MAEDDGLPIHYAAVQRGTPVYASDGVEDPPTARGTVVFRTTLPKPGKSKRVDHLNPQTMD